MAWAPLYAGLFIDGPAAGQFVYEEGEMLTREDKIELKVLIDEFRLCATLLNPTAAIIASRIEIVPIN